MIEKTCCVTGHRDIPVHKVKLVKEQLQKEIKRSITQGFQVFISGFAQGVDLYFAQLVIEEMRQHPHILLVAAIPFRGRLNTPNPLVHRCLAYCHEVHIQQESYSADCFLARNRYMVERSGKVIAVYDGRGQGGTFFTMQYAHKLDRPIREIRI